MKQGSWSHGGFTGDMMRNIANNIHDEFVSKSRTPQYLIVNVENDVQNVSTIGWFLGGHKFLTLHFSLSWNWIGSRASLMLDESGPKKSVQQE